MGVTITSIKERLAFFGYELSTIEEEKQIEYLREKIERMIKNRCHINQIPKELISYERDRICGEFLWEKKQSGTWTSLQTDPTVTSIQEGDVNVHFTGQDSAEMKLDKLIQFFMGNEEELLCYRTIKW